MRRQWKVRECARREQKLLYPLDRVSARSEQKRMALVAHMFYKSQYNAYMTKFGHIRVTKTDVEQVCYWGAVMTGLDVCVFFVCEGGIKKQ